MTTMRVISCELVVGWWSKSVRNAPTESLVAQPGDGTQLKSLAAVRGDVNPPRVLTRARPAVRAVVGVGLALVVLAVFVSLTGGRAVLTAVARADLSLVAAAGFAGVAAIASWGESLRHAVRTTKVIGGLRYRLAYFSGDFARQILPMGRLSGSAIIGYAVSRPFELKYEEALAAVTVADLLNLLTAVTVSATGLVVLVVGSGIGDVRTFVAGLVGAVVVAAGVLALVTRRRDVLERVVGGVFGVGYRLATRLGISTLERHLHPESVSRRVESYFRTLDEVGQDRKRVALTGLFAAVGWVGFGSSLALAAAALGADVPVAAALFVAPASGLVGWSPLPGGTGGIEVAVTAGLVATAGVPVSTAAAVALLYRVCSYWVVVAVDAAATGLLAALYPR
ncbi:lysylphosphatidylglycerol synthase transmembrane domain-containing protein [Halogeometricum limi]|uniref:lysylphosphatidylglycerol synthase transmembrane domain-containing protein n=1 Tax=Halogeometricum limi TaxID=555875 RepID=UPI001FE04E71|nr:lysylphosphatidylglycerol synthase transmembrane domain-containing protein [Halogeometricum limi]